MPWQQSVLSVFARWNWAAAARVWAWASKILSTHRVWLLCATCAELAAPHTQSVPAESTPAARQLVFTVGLPDISGLGMRAPEIRPSGPSHQVAVAGSLVPTGQDYTCCNLAVLIDFVSALSNNHIATWCLLQLSNITGVDHWSVMCTVRLLRVPVFDILDRTRMIWLQEEV